MKIAHLTTIDMSLRYLLLPQLEAATEVGESIGISAPGEFVPDLESRGIRHIALSSSTRGMNLMADIRAVGQLWRVLRRERPDVIHTHNPKPGVYGRIVGRLAGVPIVVNTIHGLYATSESSLLKRAIVYTLEWIASLFTDVELIQSPEDFELLRGKRIMPRSK
ncbi:MAG: glycosyltransferase, partial [Acidimicrobiia bacterium]